MNTLEAIRTRRTVRKFTNQKVDKSKIEEIISVARFVPSWKNTQTARYVAIVDATAKEKISQEMLPPYNATTVRSAPILIAMVTKCGRSGFERDGSFTTKKGDRWQYFDAGIACQTFCLTAHELGLSTVILGIYDEEKLSAFLNLQDDEVLTALIALGYPENIPEAPKKKTVEELLRFI